VQDDFLVLGTFELCPLKKTLLFAPTCCMVRVNQKHNQTPAEQSVTASVRLRGVELGEYR